MAEAIKGSTQFPANITSASTTQLVTGRGYLGSVIVNTVGSSDFTITIYDNTATAGTKIATIVNPGLKNLQFNCRFNVGLRVVTTATTHGDITVTYGSL